MNIIIYVEIFGGLSLLEIQGIDSLYGEISIQGSKNSVLPILAATILNRGTSKIFGCPKISDVYHMIEILEYIGCEVTWEGHTVTVDSRNANNFNIPSTFVSKMRSSIVFLGSLIGRFNQAVITYPGGCLIGDRPIDIHIESLKKMNIIIDDNNNVLQVKTDKILGKKIVLKLPSVGATQNIMMAAVLASGKTCIINAAREPEIIELANFLNCQGAKIKGAGTRKIIIEGVEKLKSCEYAISGDRIVAGTYLAAVAALGGYVTLKNIDYKHLEYTIALLRKAGCQIITDEDYIIINKNPSKKLKRLKNLVTKPYPGFPTDMQSQFLVALTTAQGKSTINEKIFDSRFKVVPELTKMGADIYVKNKKAFIYGVEIMQAKEVEAYELRGGAALIIAGLIAKGTTKLRGTEYIKRGYEDIVGDLNKLGAKIIEYEEEKEQKETQD